MKNLDLLCARTFEDQVLDAFCVLLPTAELSRKLSCVIGIIWMISGWEVDNIHWIYQRYLKQIFTGLSFFKSSRLSWHCSAQLIKGFTINASLESCEATFQLCILRLLTSKIPTSVQSHDSPSAGQWCFPFSLSPNYKNDHKQDRKRVVVIKTWSSLAVFLSLLAATELIDVGQHHSGPAQCTFKSLSVSRCSPNLKYWWRDIFQHYDKQKQK